MNYFVNTIYFLISDTFMCVKPATRKHKHNYWEQVFFGETDNLLNIQYLNQNQITLLEQHYNEYEIADSA